MAKTSDPNDFPSGLVIDAVFSLADVPIKSSDDTNNSNENQVQVSSLLPEVSNKSESFEKILSDSPVPIKNCSVRIKNFIEKDIKNKLTEACNNAIVKQEPEVENSTFATNMAEEDNSTESLLGRPSRKRKPNKLLSSDYLYKAEDIRQFAKLKKKKLKPEVTCQIDRDLVMSVAEKCLPEIVEKNESKDDIKMVSILPPTLKINLNDTPVLVDWKEKVAHPLPETEGRYSRPQTARTKKKLRTQEQIDKEYTERSKIKKSKTKRKSKVKSKQTNDSSPPRLEPYCGQNMDIATNSQSSSSLDVLPPQLKPYEIAQNDESKIYKQTADSVSSTIIKKSNKNYAQERTDSSPLNMDRIPCSLTGRMRKPNQQFGRDFLTEFSKLPRSVAPNKSTGSNEDTCETNTTLNHEDNTVHVAMLPNSPTLSTISSSSIPDILNTASQFAGQNLTSKGKSSNKSPIAGNTSAVSGQQSSSTKLTSAIGELAKMEKTKKFFQLVVGDKVVLIPTNGDNVVPKAFVMDIAAAKSGSSAPKISTTVPSSTTPPTQGLRTFYMNAASTGSSTVASQSKPIESFAKTQCTTITTPQTKPSQMKATIIKFPAQKGQRVQSTPIVSNTPNLPIIGINPRPTTALGQTYLSLKTPFGNVGQKVLMPLQTNTGTLSGTPFPTNIVTNISYSGKSPQTPILNSVLSSQKMQCTKQGPIESSRKVKQEPDNIKEYEKAAESFKGVPNDESDDGSDDDTKKSEKLSDRINVNVPEVGSHVPATESETGERIRKLKEKLREQQLQLENIRKNLDTKNNSEDAIS